MQDISNNFDSVINSPQKHDFRNFIYDNLSNMNSNGLDGKYGTQMALITFLNDKGFITTKSENDITIDNVAKKTFNMILREPFKLSLSTKPPADSPYVSLSNDIQKDSKKKCSYLFGLTEGQSSENIYAPINLGDDFTIKTYAGTTHPTFNLNGRIYMDKTIFSPIQNLSNYRYAINFLEELLQCILPKTSTDDEILGKYLSKYSVKTIGELLDKISLGNIDATSFILVGTAAKKALKGIDSFSQEIESLSETTYGTNIVSFAIPWIFGNLKAFGSTNNSTYTGKKVTTEEKTDKGGENQSSGNQSGENQSSENETSEGDTSENTKVEEYTIDYGRMLNAKCFVKHMGLKFSKEYYVEKTIHKASNKITTFRYPSYIDIDLTLEAVEIPSVKSWMMNWIL